MAWSEKAKAGSGSSEGTITDYSFLPYFPFDEDQEEGDNIYMLLEITPDGADEPTKRSLYLGSGQFLKIEDDGKTLVSSDDDGVPRLYDQGEVFKFIASLEEAGFPAEARFPDIAEEKKINFEAMIGWRVRVTNEIDEEATKKLGKRKVTKGKHKGKEFNRTYTKVTKVFGEAEATKPAKAEKAKGSAAAKGGKATKPADDEDEDEAPAVNKKAAVKFLKALLEGAKNGAIEKSGLPLAITRQAAKDKMDTEDRDALRKYLTDEDNLVALAEDGVIEFDPASKKQVISLA